VLENTLHLLVAYARIVWQANIAIALEHKSVYLAMSANIQVWVPQTVCHVLKTHTQHTLELRTHVHHARQASSSH
jgi:hypothetical protein